MNECTQVLRAICVLRKSYDIKIPSSVEYMTKVTEKWRSHPKFDPFWGVLGAVDGTHILIQIQRDEIDAFYFSRKSSCTMNVAIACDSQCRIIFIAPGA